MPRWLQPRAQLHAPVLPLCARTRTQVREAVGNSAAVLGFAGAPFTLATYIVEGGSSKDFAHTKRLAFGQPEVLHALLDKLADNVAEYCRYQVGGEWLTAGQWEWDRRGLGGVLSSGTRRSPGTAFAGAGGCMPWLGSQSEAQRGGAPGRSYMPPTARLITLLHLLSSSPAAWLLPQADTGAQVIQIFDSWASELMPQDFDVFSGPYIKKVIDSFR